MRSAPRCPRSDVPACAKVRNVRYTSRFFFLVPLAFAGAVAGHILGYLVSFPGANARLAALLGTGHGSFGQLAAGAVVAAAAALVALTIRARGREAIGFRWLTARLVPLQLAIFFSLEFIERGFDPEQTFDDPAVLVGLVAQVIVALGAALVARGAQEVARSIRSAGALCALRALARLPRPARASSLPHSRRGRWDARRRAPPLPQAA
jgi:hypothetical protein